MPLNLQRRRVLSVLILGAAILIAASPWTPFRRRLLVAIGSELEQPMHELEARFETTYPAVDLQWRVLGSQDMVNQALEAGQARPRVLVPAAMRSPISRAWPCTRKLQRGRTAELSNCKG